MTAAEKIANKHNEGVAAKRGDNAKTLIKSFVERIERLEEEKNGITGDIKSVYDEVKGSGLDKKALKAIVRIRKQDPGERTEHEALVETYLFALGMMT